MTYVLSAMLQPLASTVIRLACCKLSVQPGEQLVRQPHLFGSMPVQAVPQPDLICANPHCAGNAAEDHPGGSIPDH